jgi:hypothetical protein
MNPSSIQKKIDDFGSIINSQQQTLSNHQVAIDGILQHQIILFYWFSVNVFMFRCYRCLDTDNKRSTKTN